MTHDAFDLVVVGGGPAGHAAALEAAALGARVAVVEAESPGGQCVAATCIPNAIVADSVRAFVAAQEQSHLGVFDAGDDFNLTRAGSRRDQLVAHMTAGVTASLRAAGCELITGRGRIDGPRVVVGDRTLSWSSLVIATGSRWEPPAIEGIDAARITTPDGIHGLSSAPGRTAVIAGGTGRTAFSLEAAVVLALAGSSVTVLAEHDLLLPWLEPEVAQAAEAALAAFGIDVVHGDRRRLVDLDPDLVVAPDERTPFTEGLGLDTLAPGVALPAAVDPTRAWVSGVHLAGDVTGRGHLSSFAISGGRAAARAALGHPADLPTDVTLTHVLQVPELAWVGITAAEAGAAGWDAGVSLVDLAHNAHSVATGARTGLAAVVFDRELGGVLGAQAVGPGAGSIVQAASAAMQQELVVDDLAALVVAHPDPLESLVDAARRALAGL